MIEKCITIVNWSSIFQRVKAIVSVLEPLTDPQVRLGWGHLNVDTVTESKIQSAMGAIVAGQTSFVIITA